MTEIAGHIPGSRAGGGPAIPARRGGGGRDAAQAYALGADPDESTRLRRQSEELRPEAEALLARIGLRPGQAAADLRCGRNGILDLLSGAVSPDRRLLGPDADPAPGPMAAQHAPRRRPANG